MLAEHPEVFTRLRDEVLGTLGPNGKVNPENLKEMKYLRAVLNGELFFCRGRTGITDGYFRNVTVVPKCVSSRRRAN